MAYAAHSAWCFSNYRFCALTTPVHACVQAGKKGKRAADTELGWLQLAVGTALGSLRAFSAASAKQAWAATGVNEG